jgi:DNA-binding transcriptional regulator YdaS (Cro superfamily)
VNLHTYIEDTSVRRQLADDVGTSPEYLWQMAVGWRGKRASRVMAIAIERATNGAVTRQDLRPDIWPTEQPTQAESGQTVEVGDAV